MFRFFANTDNTVLIQLPPGKPSPCEAFTGYPDTRSRVVQSAQKGPTCYHYSLNYLRPRIGHHQDSQSHPLRAVEIVLSKRRKAITEMHARHNQENRLLNQLINDSHYAHHQLDQIENSRAMVSRISELLFVFKEGSQESRECKMIYDFLLPFISQSKHQSLTEFIKTRQRLQRTAINLEYLSSLGIDPKMYYQQDIAGQRYYGIEYDDLPFELLYPYLDNLIFRQYIEQYPNLQVSHWQPSDSIIGLMECLRQHGPHQVKGYFGKAFYQEPPFVHSTKIAGRNVYAFKPGTRQQRDTTASHSILLVGALIRGGKEFVLFIDPLDGSNPHIPEQQKTYIMSYDNFVSHLFNIYGQKSMDSSISHAGLMVYSDSFPAQLQM